MPVHTDSLLPFLLYSVFYFFICSVERKYYKYIEKVTNYELRKNVNKSNFLTPVSPMAENSEA